MKEDRGGMDEEGRRVTCSHRLTSDLLPMLAAAPADLPRITEHKSILDPQGKRPPH